MKISYIITTIRPFELCLKTIQSIKQLDDHDHEILISSPHDYKNICAGYDKVYYIPDKLRNGSVAANNITYKLTDGDWVAFLPDDFHLINLDINKFKDFLQSDLMQQKTFKMFSFHPRDAHKITAEHMETPIKEPYQIMHFPIVARETLDNKLDGVIFNHRFIHSFCDHWLGYYASKHEQFEPYNYSLYPENGPFITLNTDTQYRNYSNDGHDYSIINFLYEQYHQNLFYNY